MKGALGARIKHKVRKLKRWAVSGEHTQFKVSLGLVTEHRVWQ